MDNFISCEIIGWREKDFHGIEIIKVSFKILVRQEPNLWCLKTIGTGNLCTNLHLIPAPEYNVAFTL